MVEDHGHSHGLEEDMYWALHGHAHDVADHDHSQVAMISSPASEPMLEFKEAWRLRPSPYWPSRFFRIERPPRS